MSLFLEYSNVCASMRKYINTIDKLREMPCDFEDPDFVNLWVDLGELEAEIKHEFSRIDDLEEEA